MYSLVLGCEFSAIISSKVISSDHRGEPMAAVTIRNLRPETHRAIKARAKAKGRSAEAEIRAILDEAVRPEERIKVGSAIRALVMKYGGFELDIKRDQTPAGTVSFE
jgi:antitoxin FitA